MNFFLLFLFTTFTATTKKVDVTHTIFDSNVDDIQWMRNDSSVVLLLTGQSGKLWRSRDSGRTFDEITQVVASSARVPSNNLTFDSIIVHPQDKNIALLISKSRNHFKTTDGGLTWKQFGGPMNVHNFIFHPRKSTLALFSKWTDACEQKKPELDSKEPACNQMLYVTTDLGSTYRKIISYVVQYSWADKSGPEKMGNFIYFTYHTDQKGHQNRVGGWHQGVDFAVTENFGRSHKVLVKGGNKFLVSRQYMFVAKVSDYLRQTVNLMVSSDYGRQFKKAQIPTTLIEKSYTILDTSEGGVVIHVNHGSSGTSLEGNIYVSDPEGLRYALSLPNNIRASSGECEFDRILGLDGVYIANFRDNTAEINENANTTVGAGPNIDGTEDQLSQRHNKRAKKTSSIIRTVISFDKGGYWRYLRAPKIDSRGVAITCEESSRCYLHLHGITHFDRFAPFYSIENALGIVMGTGNVGSHLTRDVNEVNTYISRDAGLTWHEAHKGAYIYEYGDHGGLIVMANDAGATNQVVFSWNEGHSWYDFDLGVSKAEVDNIVIEPTSTGLEFLLYGTVADKGAVFHLDFAKLDQPQCQGAANPNAASSDYELWQPSDGTKRECLLGRKMQFVRKRVTSECFNGRDFTRQKTTTLCPCTPEDYECEVGFFRSVESDAGCQPSPYEDRAYMAVEGCTSSDIYYTQAYRKVPGDQCQNGFTPPKVPVPCPPNSPLAPNAKATLALLVLVGSGLCFVAWASKHPVLRKYFGQTGLDTFMEVGYQVVDKAADTMQRGGEELFNFWSSTTSGVSPGQGNQVPRFGVVDLSSEANQITVESGSAPFYGAEMTSDRNMLEAANDALPSLLPGSASAQERIVSNGGGGMDLLDHDKWL